MAQERANALKDQFIMDMHTHFPARRHAHPDFVRQREAVGKAGWNPALIDKPQTIEDLKWNNYFKEVFLDSDTKIALISSAPSDVPQDWFLTNEMTIAARERVNREAGSKRMMAHAIFTPGSRLARASRACAGDEARLHQGLHDRRQHQQGQEPVSLADGRREVTYKAIELAVKHGIKNICVHKGLFPSSIEKQFPAVHRLQRCARCRQGGEGLAAAQLRHLSLGVSPCRRRYGRRRLERDRADCRISWTSDLAEIPEKFGVTNVYGDVGQLFAQSVVAEPRLGAALMGTLVKGLGADHVCWGTDAIWTGSPQWQIEALRRLEIPEDMQKRYGFAALGGPTYRVKTAIFSGNNMRLYGRAKRSDLGDRFAARMRSTCKTGPAQQTALWLCAQSPARRRLNRSRGRAPRRARPPKGAEDPMP
jgi:hypothetical protein